MSSDHARLERPSLSPGPILACGSATSLRYRIPETLAAAHLSAAAVEGLVSPMCYWQITLAALDPSGPCNGLELNLLLDTAWVRGAIAPRPHVTTFGIPCGP